ncbi:uncharacterized protein LOC128553035, partial [Mercenaria mercenaria]|uniref:uncharacterized protein LOC128553035 n=1 Tax=Mercenaria mercenaria TaxID=6596 RepID=UPI00234EA4D4
FSFEISHRGEIGKVFHQPDEEHEILMVKKGFAGMLSAKLHHRHEIEHESYLHDGWRYETNEHGREGFHNATYIVNKTTFGFEYVKTRNKTNVKSVNGNSTYAKMLHFHDDLNTIHSVMIEEEFNIDFSTKAGFNPFYGMRPVEATTGFSEMGFPSIIASSKDRLIFLKKTQFTVKSVKPLDLKSGRIHHTNKLTKRSDLKTKSDIQDTSSYIAGNLSCIRHQPEKGSPEVGTCFHNLVLTLGRMDESDVEDITDEYFLSVKRTNRGDKNTIADALVAINYQRMIVDKVLNNLRIDEELLMSVLTSLTTIDKEPTLELLTTVEKFCFKGRRSEKVLLSRDIRYVSCLTFGGLVGSVRKYGQSEYAEQLVQYLHDELGLHDPWLFEMKRSVMTEVECVEHDHNKVVLLDAIGNAGLPVSYEHILSHINSTNSQWIKRTGIHALRKFHDFKTLEQLERVALYDDDDTVRYEALLQYQAHPLADVDSTGDGTGLARAGISKRSILDAELAFRLEAPGVDWRKQIGSSSIGASFGLIMENLLDLKMSLIKGSVDVRVHDEAYVKIHLGFIGKNIDFFLARICFKGGAKYALNILKELDPKLGFDLIKQFTSIVNNVVGAVKKGVEAFKKIISTDFSLKDIVDNFVKSVAEMPDKISNLAGNIYRVMKKLAVFKLDSLPSFIKPVMKFINAVVRLYEKVKADIMTFYNSIVQAVKVVIPKAAKDVFDAVQDIIDGFMNIFKDYKTSLFRIGAGVIRIYTNINILKDTKNEIMNHTFINEGEKPYWIDLTEDVETIAKLYHDAVKAIKEKGPGWLNEKVENDIAEKVTKGKTTLKIIKQKIQAELKSEIKSLMAPLDSLRNMGGGFLKHFEDLFDTYKDLKEAYVSLKEGYEFARSLVDRIFGPKFHKDFPREKRVSGGGCSGEGFYPSKLGNGNNEYQNDGIDLLNRTGEQLVAPFSGTVIRSENENEIILLESGELPPGSELIIRNIEPEEDIMHPHDPSYDEKKVSAGVVIGTVTKSPCGDYNHIHLSIRREGGFVDPSNYVSQRPVELPKWTQLCDDYKVVYKGETIVSGVIVGPNGREENDTSKEVPEDESLATDDMDVADQPGQDVEEIKDDPDGIYSKLTKRRRKRNALKTVVASLETLINNIKGFLKRFSIRRIKMGQIIQFLDDLGLDKTKEKMSQLMSTVKEAIDHETCGSPYQMSDAELENALLNRGKQAEGSRDDMIKELLHVEHNCPFISFTLPTTKLLYCTLDEKCLGLECCLTIEAFDMLQKTFKAYVRLDPDPLALSFGVDSWNYVINSSKLEGEVEDVLKTNMNFEFLDGQEVIVKYKIHASIKGLKLSFGVGLCDPDDQDECLTYTELLKDAIFPFPRINEDGTIAYELPDFSDYVDDIEENLIESGQEVLDVAVDAAIEHFLDLLGIPEDLLLNGPPCRTPENMDEADLIEYLTDRQLPTDGSREELNKMFWNSELSCSLNGKDLHLPEIPVEFLHYYISENCMRIDACAELQIPGIDKSRSFSAYVELDPCRYVLTAAFEGMDITVILFEYDWGKDEVIKLASDFKITFNIGKDDVQKVFKIGLRVKLGAVDIDIKLLDGFEVPIPVCNGNFSLQGNLESIADALGGEINREVFDLLLKQLGIDEIIREGSCTLPPPPTDCPPSMNISNMIPPFMKNFLRCELADNCFGISCCVEIDFTIPLSSVEVEISFPVWFKMDPCDFHVDTGISALQFEEQLLKYEWGKESSVSIGSGKEAPINIIYAIDNYEDGFIIDLRVEICLPMAGKKFCIPENGLSLLNGEKIPACSLTAWKNLTDFSLREWMESKGENVGEQLSNAGRDALVDILGLNDLLLSPPCDRKRSPYSPSVSGWHNMCPQSFVNPPALPRMVSCSVPDYCTGINCCLDLGKIGLSIKAYIDVNMCNYIISGGIETQTFKFSLFSYEWGKTETFSIEDFFRIRYTIRKPKNEKVFIITLELAVCLEKDGSCMFETKLLDGTKVPQLGCDMSFDFSNFSVTSWLENNGLGNLGPLDDLWGDAVKFVAEVIGLDKYFLEEQCDVNKDPFKNATSSWNNECPKLTKDLPEIPGSSVCHIATSCTAIDCCINVDYLRRSLHVSFNIDFCNFTIRGNLEKLNFNFNIIDFKWGEQSEETILKLIKIRYTIDKTEKNFVVDLSVAVCMDSTEPCQFTTDIFKNTMIPIPVCNLDAGLSLGNFSLSNWLKEIGHTLDDNLPSAVIALLLSKLNIDKFQLKPPCSATDTTYTNAVNGWNSDCNASISLPKLPEEIVCYMTDYCTGIDCCISVDILRTTIHVSFLLDMCKYKLTMGIERLEEEILLLDYKWGQDSHFTLGGFFRIEYKIDDLQSKKTFIANVKLKICFEQNTCLFEMEILKDAYVPKPLCDWNVGLTIPDFSLTNWMGNLGYELDGDTLKDFMIEKLFDALGIAKYLEVTECKRELYPYINATDGWMTECPKSIKSRALPDFITCHVPSYCTGVDCCVTVGLVKRSFKVYLHLDACNYVFTVGIEKFGVNISLLDYEWGKTEEFSLLGALRIRYSVINLEAEKQYVLNLKMSICIKSGDCEENLVLLEDARLPKFGCDWNTSLSDFSLEEYLESIGSQIGNIGDDLPDIIADKLLEQLGVAMYMNRTQCQSSADNKLINECERMDIQLKVPEIMTCSIPAHCTAVECCISVPLIGRALSIAVDLDACAYQLRLKVERFSKEIRLFDFEWGIWQSLDIKGVFKIEYLIDDLKSSKQFVISVRARACFDGNRCSLDVPIVENLLLPKPLCNFNGAFKLPDFSYDKWIKENTDKVTGDLTNILRSRLFEELGITPYLLKDECNVELPNVGWKSDCPVNISLPALPENMMCHLLKHCTGFACCVNIPLLKRSFSFHLDLDSCNYALIVGIEKLEYNQSLINYEFGTKKNVDLFGVVQL